VEEVALWSGGLDALAGVYTRLKSFPERSFPLFGTGSNDNTFARQQKVFRALNPLFPNRLELCRAPIRFSKSNHQQKNKLSRARGVVFTMLGSAYSYLRGHRALHVYENGIGAINLPYRQSAVGLDHSRSVRPETLVGISHFMTELIGVDIRVRNPFLFSTKAEMCRQLAEDAQFELTSLTSSCDSPHRRWPTQCGYCSSCILRKQALCASHLEDKTKYIVPHATPPSGNACLYLHNMLDQVSTLRQQLKESDNPLHQWRSLSKRFPELDDIVDRTCDAEDLSPPEMRNKLIRMYDAYSSEWAVVESQISEQFETQRSDQQACQTSQNSIQQGSLCL
jgi:7-cyano-7-deazaguanine synthase in queuosine biosynthesis